MASALVRGAAFCRLKQLCTAKTGSAKRYKRHLCYGTPNGQSLNPEALQSLPKVLLALRPLLVACARHKQVRTLPLCKHKAIQLVQLT